MLDNVNMPLSTVQNIVGTCEVEVAWNAISMYFFFLHEHCLILSHSTKPNAIPRQGKLHFSEEYTERHLARLNKAKVIRRQAMKESRDS